MPAGLIFENWTKQKSTMCVKVKRTKTISFILVHLFTQSVSQNSSLSHSFNRILLSLLFDDSIFYSSFIFFSIFSFFFIHSSIHSFFRTQSVWLQLQFLSKQFHAIYEFECICLDHINLIGVAHCYTFFSWIVLYRYTVYMIHNNNNNQISRILNRTQIKSLLETWNALCACTQTDKSIDSHTLTNRMMDSPHFARNEHKRRNEIILRDGKKSGKQASKQKKKVYQSLNTEQLWWFCCSFLLLLSVWLSVFIVSGSLHSLSN